MSDSIIDTLTIATAAALDFKARLYRRDHRRNVARKVYLEQEKRLEDKLVQVLTPLFEQEIEETVARLLELAPEEPDGTKSTTDPSPLLSLAFDSSDPRWKREIVDRALPVLAVGMLEAMTAQMMETGVDPRRKGTKHLPGQHNQMSHGRGGGGAVVPDALGRQVYIDEEGHARTGPCGKLIEAEKRDAVTVGKPVTATRVTDKDGKNPRILEELARITRILGFDPDELNDDDFEEEAEED